MDIQPTNQQPISDDQELAKVLAGVNQQADAPATASETPEAAPAVDTAAEAPAAEEPVEAEPTMAEIEQNAAAEEPVADYAQPAVEPAPAALSGDLESVKNAALSELRPLMDKLDISPEDKFDTYLLLLRSTDDKDLIAPAHEAAKNISDESARAKALLDIIKEIDYLSNPGQQKSEAVPAAEPETPATSYYQ